VEEDGEVHAVATSEGYVEQRGRDGREVPLTAANRIRIEESDRLRRQFGAISGDERHVRGLVLDGTQLVALLVGRDPLPIVPLRTPTVFVRTLSDNSIEVLGFHFLPGTREQEVALLVEGDTVAAGVPVGPDGRFETHVRIARHPPGWVVVTAAQVDGLRTTLATTSLQVVSRERE